MDAKAEPLNGRTDACTWVDPDGETWEFQHIVTQTEAEGPEYTLFRIPAISQEWQRWDEVEPNIEPPLEVMEFFFGPVLSTEQRAARVIEEQERAREPGGNR